MSVERKQTTTQAMGWLHTWGGLIAGWVLFLVFLTGTISVFFQEVSFWMQPERIAFSAMSDVQSARIAQRFAEDHHLDDARLLIRFPNERRPDIRVGVQRPGKATENVYLDQEGREIGARATIGGYLFYNLHWRLNIDRDVTEFGVWLVGLATAVMLALLITGIVIHKRILKDIFVFRPRSSYQRSWLDAHNVFSVLALPFLFVIAFTGLVLVYYIYMPAGITALYGGDRDKFRRESVFSNRAEGIGIPLAHVQPLDSFVRKATDIFGEGNIDSIRIFPKNGRTDVEVWRTRVDRIGQQMDRLIFDGQSGNLQQMLVERAPIQRVQSVLAGLHLVEFGGRPMHWLYFVMGLFGAGSIASGLVLFVIKRQRKVDTFRARRWLALAGRINVAAIAGLCVACIGYLWSNRLLPATMAGRELLEVQSFFAVWALCLLHALRRPQLSAWIEQLYAAGALAVLLPVANVITTGQWLGSYLRDRDWERFSVELTVLVAGALLMLAARSLLRRRTRQGQLPSAAPLAEAAP